MIYKKNSTKKDFLFNNFENKYTRYIVDMLTLKSLETAVICVETK